MAQGLAWQVEATVSNHNQFPNMSSSQVALLHAETATGIILELDGGRRWNRDIGTSYWVVFESLELAKAYAEKVISADPRVECAIFDHNKVELICMRRVVYDELLDGIEVSAGDIRNDLKKAWSSREGAVDGDGVFRRLLRRSKK